MKSALLIVTVIFAAILVGGYLFWPKSEEVPPPLNSGPTSQPAGAGNLLRLGLVPEHDVFALKRSYKGMEKYLGEKLGRPVEFVTLSTYEAVLADFKERQIDGAFLGSLVALIAIDRYGAQVIAKPEQPDGVSTYRGIIFVRENSPVKSLDDLGGRSIGMLRATYAGSLFPLAELAKRNLLQGSSAPKMVWMGTHDEVIDAVVSGRVEVGAVKDLRLAAYEKRQPDVKLRRLATSKPVPNNALVLRGDVAEQLGRQIAEILRIMENEPEGRGALSGIGAKRFIACRRDEYDAILEMAEPLGSAWTLVGVNGQAPKRPESQ